jgi:hypothetical protein
VPLWQRPNLDGVGFPVLRGEDNVKLTRTFALEEIEEVVMESDGNKSPGPDGFNFNFIKAFWSLMKGEVRILFDQFHGNDCLPKSFASYFVALIPKVSSPLSLGEYRPISLLGCLYKLIANVLAKRLGSVLNSLVESTQTAFLKGRHLVDGVMVINEVVDLAKKTGRECIILKVDFEKAYDSVDWSFLDYMLGRFGFCSKWRSWMRACVFAGNMSILLNGSPTEEINIKRGLKQGDPLAPFLFLLVAEGLGGLMKKAVGLSRFRGFRFGSNGVVVSHLQYADDTLCIGEPSIENLWMLKVILRGFELVSGLKVNFWKSSLMGINVSQNFIRLAATFLNCRVGVVPFKYLGLPVDANHQRMATWEPLINSLRKRLGSWNNKFVSLGGRIVLLNAVLNAIPIFYLSFLKMPVQVWKKIRRIQREFLWGSRNGRKLVNWVKWEDVCKPKSLGGLGVRDLRVVNISLLTKWKWRLLSSSSLMWKEVIRSKYGDEVIGRVEWGEGSKPWFSSLWWKDICSIGLNLDSNWYSQGVKRIVGNGASTKFWLDSWIGNLVLKDHFPRLFSITSQKDATIASVWRRGEGNSWNFNWRRRLFVWEEALVTELLGVIQGVTLAEREDKWSWQHDTTSEFSVKSTYDFLSNLTIDRNCFSLECLSAFKAIWKCTAPSKVLGFSWMLLHDRIPTKTNLFRRHILQNL